MTASPQSEELSLTPQPSRDSADTNSRLEIVISTMREMSSQTDPQQMVQAYAKRMKEMFPQDGMVSLSRRELEAPRVRITRSTRWKNPPNPWKQKQLLPILDGGLFSELIYGDRPVLLDDFPIAPDDPAREYLEGYRSLLAIPHFHEGKALNMVVHFWKEPGVFDPRRLPDLVLTSNLFGRATYNLQLRDELSRAYSEVDRELQAVASIQRSLLPKTLPEIAGVQLAASYQTSRRAGGDYYDLFPLPGGLWGIFIADVSGHGTPAAVMMAITHSIAHSYPGPHAPPGAMLDYLNEKLVALYTVEFSAFVTAFYGIYDPAKKTLTYSSAGHNPPRLRRRDGSILLIDAAGGIPLGIMQTQPFEQATVQLVAGDTLLFYTDGITETFSPAGDMFGYGRLDEILRKEMSADAERTLAAVLQAVEAFGEGQPAADDRTALVMRVK